MQPPNHMGQTPVAKTTCTAAYQTCQLTRILRETHAFGQSVTLTRKYEDVSRITDQQTRCVLIFNPVSTNLVATCYFEKIRKLRKVPILFILPHSNALEERVFSMVSKNIFWRIITATGLCICKFHTNNA